MHREVNQCADALATLGANLGCVWHWLKKLFFFFYYLAYFCYYSWVHCIFWYYLWVSLYYFNYLLALSTILSTKSFHFQLNKLFSNGLLDFSFILFNNPLFVRDRAPSPFLVLGQTHVYRWNHVITSIDPTFCTPYDSSPCSLMMLKL